MVLEGRVCSGDQFIATKEQAEAITSTFGGLCAEMEGAAIAQVCHLNQVPYVIIRAISDDSDDMTFEQFQAEAARECAGAVLAMVSARS
jgi:adenosylhomocysteine nucleosidase